MKSFLISIAFYIYNSFISNIPSYFIRKFYLTQILKYKIGRKTSIHMGCFFTGTHISIGNNSVINRKCYLDGRGGLQIGSNVSLSPECYIISLTHKVRNPEFIPEAKAVSISDYCWLGSRSVVLPGVHLGRGTTVGAGSVVTKSSNEKDIVAGNPAKKIGERNIDFNYTLNYFPWFNSDV